MAEKPIIPPCHKCGGRITSDYVVGMFKIKCANKGCVEFFEFNIPDAIKKLGELDDKRRI